MSFKAKEWVNAVYDDEGNVLRKGTPLMAEDMNKIEDELEEVSNSRGKPNGIATLNENGIVHSTQLPTNLKEIRVVANIAERDTLDKFEGLRVLVTDATTDDTVDEGWAEYVWNGTKFVKVAEAESLDMVLAWANIKDKPSEYNPSDHTHSSSDIEGLYVTHEHNNKDIVDGITQGTISKINTNEERIEVLESDSSQLHTHDNKGTLDKIVYNGEKTSIDLVLLDELENHTHNYGDLKNKPTNLETTEGAQQKANTAEQNANDYTNQQVSNIPSVNTDDFVSKQGMTDHATSKATKSDYGHVKIGEGLNVTDGVVSVADIDGLHTHNNKGTLDKLAYTGAKPTIDLIIIEEMENHTHDYSNLQNKPTKLSEFENDRGFITELSDIESMIRDMFVEI